MLATMNSTRRLLLAAQLLWCLLGAAGAMAIVLLLIAPPRSPLLLASTGGTAVFLFGLTRVDAAQPRALFGGHLGSALIGITCYKLFGDIWWAYALAESLALGFMLLTRTVHPPAGANPIIMLQAHADFGALLTPVLASVGCLAVAAFLWSRVLPGTFRYPVRWMPPSPVHVSWGAWRD